MATTQARSGLDWEGTALPEAPTAPETLQESGLSLPFLNDLLLRTLYTRGALLGLDMARHLCLPFKVIEEALRWLKDDKTVEVQGGDLIGRVSYRFNLTELGRKRAQDAMKQCAYVGPAPVPLEDNEATIRRLMNTGSVDPRWVRIRRPVIVTGGELNLDMLDLRYNSMANYYQAPLHVKANGGVFLIDDFGRQLCSPKELLNRW